MITIDGVWLVLDGEYEQQGGASNILFRDALEDTSVTIEEIARNICNPSHRQFLKKSARDGSYLYVRAKDLGSGLSNLKDFVETIHWLGWNVLAWHISNFNSALPAKSESPCAPLAVLSLGNYPRDIPSCDALKEYMIFQGHPLDDTCFPAWFKQRFHKKATGRPSHRITKIILGEVNNLHDRHLRALSKDDLLFLDLLTEPDPVLKVRKTIGGSKVISPRTVKESDNVKELMGRLCVRNPSENTRQVFFLHSDAPPSRERPLSEQLELEYPNDSQVDQSIRKKINYLRVTFPTQAQLNSKKDIKRFIYTTVYVFDLYASTEDAKIPIKEILRNFRNFKKWSWP